MSDDQPQARFLGGTLALEGVERDAGPPQPFRWIEAKWRCPAYHYRVVRPWMGEPSIRNRVPRWRKLSLTLQDEREPHAYQAEALGAWLDADCWGSVVLPTGADPLGLSHAYTVTRSFTARIAVWNCGMLPEEALSDTLTVSVVDRPTPSTYRW